MDNEHKKLEHFTATILSDANERSRKILEALEKARKARLAAAEKEIRVRNEREIEAGIAKVKSSTGRLVSQQMMENKRELFAKRGEVARRIAADVRGKLEDWVQTDAYHSWLQEQLAAALEQLPQGSQGVTVYCREQDQQYLAQALQGCARPHQVESSQLIELGGLRLECPGSHMVVDCTLDSSFGDLREHIAEYIGLRLE